ncbi:MAG: sodium:solute symporter [Chitinophagaceae bacterium]|nr:sodium:solute symporter [Chitinophagaceae bacterium]
MTLPDWIVLGLTLVCIIGYGLYKSRTTKNLEGYFLSNRELPWYMVLLSIMGTQASAITYLSGPGQAYTDGMRFVQYYFGLPLAMVVICITFVPIFHKLKVYTAYEFLEQRFGIATSTFTSFLFLLQRGLSTGISVAAPSIILSSLLGWDLWWTNIFMGGVLIVYTVMGGAKAVAYTQTLQFIIIFVGMFAAGYMVVHLLPEGVGFFDALKTTGQSGKLNVITSGVNENGFDWTDKYNIWSGIIGSFFLMLSYFGTDQVQVGRYLAAKSTTESKLGLLMNGLIKVPMQFLILLVGAMVFTFYQYNKAPLFFNQSQVEKIKKTEYAAQVNQIEKEYDSVNALKRNYHITPGNSIERAKEINVLQKHSDSLRSSFKTLLKKPGINGESNDTNYIFLRFVVDYLPKGLVGLLIAVIFLAAWGAIAAALNSLASSTMVDFHKRFSKRELGHKQEYNYSQFYTFLWGVFCVIVAQFATSIGNSLIEAVNVLGSLFYGVILGIFLVAFYLKYITGKVVFISALIVQVYIILSFLWPWITMQFPTLANIPDPVTAIMSTASTIGFLWLNGIGALGVVLLSILLHPLLKQKLVTVIK